MEDKSKRFVVVVVYFGGEKQAELYSREKESFPRPSLLACSPSIDVGRRLVFFLLFTPTYRTTRIGTHSIVPDRVFGKMAFPS